MEVRSDRWYSFDATRQRVWDAFGSTGDYQSWWPWLQEFGGGPFAEGARWECVVSPPLPYLVRFTITLVAVHEARSVRATVEGEIAGRAEIELVDDRDGASCRLHLTSELAPTQPALRLVAIAARPVVRRGHDWVLDTGARQFRERAL